MRKATLLLAVFGLVGLLWAADPTVGTWKANVSKSKFAPSTQAAPKEQMLIVRELADQFELSITGIRTDGSPITGKYTVPKQGGVVKRIDGTLAQGLSIIDTVIGPGNVYGTYIQDGKQTQLVHRIVSKDGKTMNWTSKGTDNQGKPFESLVLYERQ